MSAIELEIVAGLRANEPLVLRDKLEPSVCQTPLLARPRLQLETVRIRARPLTIVHAPSGFGKTRLLQQWHAEFTRDRFATVAWLGLDETDDDPNMAISSLLASLARATRGSARICADIGGSPHRRLTSLLNSFGDSQREIFLFVDNYDVVAEPRVHEIWQYLASHLPHNVHGVFACRTRPPWPVHRLGLDGLAKTLEADELRFTLGETTEFLREHCAVALDDNQVLRLHQHARGWAAAIKLATIAIDRDADSREIDSILRGSNPLLVDYIEENIIASLDAKSRNVLTKTAHLESIHPRLCDFLCQTRDSAECLQHLEQSNLVRRAGQDGEWYEYSPVVRHALRNSFDTQNAAAVESLRRASIDWFRQQGMPREALLHALHLRDFEIAVAVVENDGRDMVISGYISVLLEFFEGVPECHLRRKPHLLVHYLWALIITQRYREAQEQLERMQYLIREICGDLHSSHAPSEGQIRVIEHRIRQAREPGCTDLIFWQRQKSSLDQSDRHGLEQVELALGWACLRKEMFGEAYTAFMEARRHAEVGRVPVPVTVITATTHMASIRKMQGKLSEALGLCSEAITFSQQERFRRLPVAGVSYLQRSELHYEVNRLDKAEADLLAATSLFEQYSLATYDVQARIQVAKMACLRGGPSAALQVLDGLDGKLCEHSREYLLEQIRAEQARYFIAGGDLVTAGAILKQQRLPIDSRTPSPAMRCRQRERRGYLALCRYLIASDRPQAASAWLTKLMHQAQASGNRLFGVELAALLALAHAREGGESRTLRSVREMLLLGESCGAVRCIVDEGNEIIVLIRRYAEQRLESVAGAVSSPTQDYIQLLLGTQKGASVERPCRGTGWRAPVTQPGAVLTTREQEILQMIARGMGNRSISQHLILSEGTVKWHVKNIFSKLTVNSRTQAVAKARSSGVMA